MPCFSKNHFFAVLTGKSRVKLNYFFWYSPLFKMRQKLTKNKWNCNLLNFNQVESLSLQFIFKYFFPKTYTSNSFLSNSTTNHFFSFQLSPIRKMLSVSATIGSVNISNQTAIGLFNL